ncbi:MAG TPA: DoxX family protein [Candidatus Obscuribacterales bacterium]|nr:DoxX family protein [Candidatus Obscuribacterales bacterium]
MIGFFDSFVGKKGSVGLLLLRLVAGAGMFMHGYPKLAHATSWMGADSWAPGWLQAMAVFSEVGGGLFLALGLLTPIACFAILGVMTTAMFSVHFPAGHPFVAKSGPSYESALLYFAIAFSYLMVGPGQFAIDALLFKRKQAVLPRARTSEIERVGAGSN